MFQATKKISGSVLWLYAHLLFWLSLIPFVIAWMGGNHFAAIPTTSYGIILIMRVIAYYFLAHALQDFYGQDSVFSKALNKDRKRKLSIVLNAVGIPF